MARVVFNKEKTQQAMLLAGASGFVLKEKVLSDLVPLMRQCLMK